MVELIFKDEVYNIVGAAMEVHKVLGPGFLETVYQEALAIEFDLKGIPFIEHQRLRLDYKGHLLKATYIPDFLCYEEIVVEIKALRQCSPNDEKQILNAIKSSKKKQPTSYA